MKERLFGARTGFFMDSDGNGGGGGDASGSKKQESLAEMILRRAKEAKERMELISKASRLNKAHGRRTPKSRIKEATGVKVTGLKIPAQQVARDRGSSEE